MNAYIRESIPAAARNFIGLFFIIASYLQLTEIAQYLAAGDEAQWLLIVKGLPVVAELAGGWLLVIGWKARPVSLMLAFLILGNGIACAAVQPCPLNEMLKDLALLGSLLQVASFGAGMYSADQDAVDDMNRSAFPCVDRP